MPAIGTIAAQTRFIHVRDATQLSRIFRGYFDGVSDVAVPQHCRMTNNTLLRSRSRSRSPQLGILAHKVSGTVKSCSSISSILSLPGYWCQFVIAMQPYKRRKTLLACNQCRDRKTRCSGDRPLCRSCQERHLQCQYEQASIRTSS